MQFYLEITTNDPSIYTLDHPKFIVSSQKKRSIGAQRIKYDYLIDWSKYFNIVDIKANKMWCHLIIQGDCFEPLLLILLSLHFIIAYF